jgi:hypothetical protein
MNVRRLFVSVALVAATGSPATTHAQGLSVDVSTGRIAYDPITTGEATHNIAGTVRYDTVTGHRVYGSTSAPLRSGDPLWGAIGAGARLLLPRSEERRVTAGADVSGEGFLFRDRVVLQTGKGGSFDALPFVRLSRGAAGVELRSGWRGQALSMGGVVDSGVQRRGVFETGARATYDAITVRAEADMRWVRASEGTFPFLGGSVIYGNARGYVSFNAGRWLSDVLDDAAWGGGGGVAVGRDATVWFSAQQQASDPLYWNAPRRTWSVGVTQRLGAPRTVLRPATRLNGGDVVIRLPVTAASGAELWVAGDFNGWKAARMQRDGTDWVLRVPLAPGVYKYSFRGADGKWFVPASVPGRRDDGMGGHVAVLVVS